MIIVNLRYPTPEEIRALERAARRARAEAIAGVVSSAVRGLARSVARAAALLTGRNRGSSAPARRTV
jgi:hypothetical protein